MCSFVISHHKSLPFLRLQAALAPHEINCNEKWEDPLLPVRCTLPKALPCPGGLSSVAAAGRRALRVSQAQTLPAKVFSLQRVCSDASDDTSRVWLIRTLIFHHLVHISFTPSPVKQKETLGFLQAATQGALLGRQGSGWYNEWLSAPGPRPWIRLQV